MVYIPAQYRAEVSDAAAQLGIPESVVASQIWTESRFDPTVTSPAGAEGIAQFMPGTWSSYGSGSPFDPTAAFAAYVKYMTYLLRRYGGNVRNALGAYNAGPGNYQAGWGYADHILDLAGANANLKAGGGLASGDQGAQNASVLGGILQVPGQIITAFSDADRLLGEAEQWFLAMTKPSTYVRLAVGALAVIALVFGMVAMGRAAQAA